MDIWKDGGYMDGWIYGWMVDIWMDEWMDEEDGCMDEKRKDKKMDGWWMDEKDGCMKGRKNGRNGRMEEKKDG